MGGEAAAAREDAPTSTADAPTSTAAGSEPAKDETAGCHSPGGQPDADSCPASNHPAATASTQGRRIDAIAEAASQILHVLGQVSTRELSIDGVVEFHGVVVVRKHPAVIGMRLPQAQVGLSNILQGPRMHLG